MFYNIFKLLHYWLSIVIPSRKSGQGIRFFAISAKFVPETQKFISCNLYRAYSW